jgi:hypothetical protein
MVDGIPDIFRSDAVPKGGLIKLYTVVCSHRLHPMPYSALKKMYTQHTRQRVCYDEAAIRSFTISPII